MTSLRNLFCTCFGNEIDVVLNSTHGCEDNQQNKENRPCQPRVAMDSNPPALRRRKADQKLRNLDILVVDDSIAIAKMTSMALKKLGHDVVTACNGKEALDMLKKKQFDIVLCDIQMPVMDGIEATTLFREFEVGCLSEGTRSKKQRIIGMSASGEQETRTSAMQAGMDHFVRKPFKMDVLLRALNDIGEDFFEICEKAPHLYPPPATMAALSDKQNFSVTRTRRDDNNSLMQREYAIDSPRLPAACMDNLNSDRTDTDTIDIRRISPQNNNARTSQSGAAIYPVATRGHSALLLPHLHYCLAPGEQEEEHNEDYFIGDLCDVKEVERSALGVPMMVDAHTHARAFPQPLLSSSSSQLSSPSPVRKANSFAGISLASALHSSHDYENVLASLSSRFGGSAVKCTNVRAIALSSSSLPSTINILTLLRGNSFHMAPWQVSIEVERTAAAAHSSRSGSRCSLTKVCPLPAII